MLCEAAALEPSGLGQETGRRPPHATSRLSSEPPLPRGPGPWRRPGCVGGWVSSCSVSPWLSGGGGDGGRPGELWESTSEKEALIVAWQEWYPFHSPSHSVTCQAFAGNLSCARPGVRYIKTNMAPCHQGTEVWMQPAAPAAASWDGHPVQSLLDLFAETGVWMTQKPVSGSPQDRCGAGPHLPWHGISHRLFKQPPLPAV